MTVETKRMTPIPGRVQKGMQAAMKVGDAGEALVRSAYPHGLLRYRGKEYDMIRDDGAKVELKTDQKSSTSTSNVFMERWTVSERGKKPGSIWTCQELGVDVFLYLFMGDKVLLECEDIPRLVHRVEACVRAVNLPLKVISNGHFHGEGWAVPYAELRDLFVRYTLEGDKFHVAKK